MKTANSGFPKKERIASRSDFSRLYRVGQRIQSPCFVLYAAPNNLEHHRLGLTVSSKIGNAVLRNRTKRILREAYRLHKGSVLGQSTDLVVSAKRSIAGASFWEISVQFAEAIARIVTVRQQQPAGGSSKPGRGREPRL